MDINLPGINGLEATRRIVDERPGTIVILLSTYTRDDLPDDARRLRRGEVRAQRGLQPDRAARDVGRVRRRPRRSGLAVPAQHRPARRASRTCRARLRPGGVDDEHRYSPSTGVAHGCRPRHRAGDELAEVGRSAVDVAADVVGVVALCIAAGTIVCRPTMRSRKPGANRSTWASMRSVMSTLGAVRDVAVRPGRLRCPPGRGVGSNGVCCANSTYGRSGWPPCCTVCSASAISAASRRGAPSRHRARAGLVHGIGPVERPVHLPDARPVAEPLERRRYAPGAGPPAIATTWRGVRSSSTARAAGSSSSELDAAAALDRPAVRLEQRRRARPRSPASRPAPSASRRGGRARRSASP